MSAENRISDIKGLTNWARELLCNLELDEFVRRRGVIDGSREVEIRTIYFEFRSHQSDQQIEERR